MTTSPPALTLSRLPGTPEPQMFLTGADGNRLAGDHWGPDTGPLVLLLHGGGQTRHAWKGAGETLGQAGYYAVAYDARGHGDSDWVPGGDYSIDGLVRDLENVIKALGNRRPVLVGASMGGGTSLVATGEDHVDATALVLVDIAPQVRPEGLKNISDFMGLSPDGFASLEAVAAAIATYQPHRRKPPTLDGLAKNVRLGSDGKYHWHWDPAFLLRHRDVEARERRFEGAARGLTLPTLLVRGGLSDILSEEGAAAFCRTVPHAEYVNVNGAGHMVAGDRNDIFANAVIEFLMRVNPIGGTPLQPPHEPQPRDSAAPGLVDIP